MANEPDPLVVNRTEPDPPPPEEEVSDEVGRRWLKAKFGQDDPEAFRTRLAEADEARESIPQYQRAVGDLVRKLTEIQEAPPPRDPNRRATPEEDEAELERVARLDPWKAIKQMQKQGRMEMARMAALAEERGARRAKDEMEGRDYASRLMSEWPEAYDDKHELYQTAGRIFQGEMSDAERKTPQGFFAAAERAAARLGIPPKSRRNRPAEPTRDTTALSSQNVSRRGTKPDKVEGDTTELTPKEKSRLKAMGIDEKVYRTARAARKAGQNVVVED